MAKKRPDDPREVIGKRAARLYAAQALIASTTPGLRFLMLRAGFIRFQPTGKIMFSELAGWTFDSNDLRRIYEFVGRYAQRMEGHMWPGMEKLYQLERRKFSADRIGDDDGPGSGSGGGSDISVEAVRDGSKRRVH